MLESFLTFIKQFDPSLKKSTTLLTISGGLDSMVMAQLFSEAQLPAIVAHCNFHLRGEDSVRDATFVQEMAQNYGFEFFLRDFHLSEYKALHKVSTQMAAREVRYAWFEQLRTENACRWIATAHHIDDSIETTLLNLARGTGLAGLKGIRLMNNAIIRPLLFASRKDIIQYAKEKNIAWREDSSNATVDYARNMIRHRVTPVLKALNPSLEEGFKTTSEKINSANTLLSNYLSDWSHSICKVLTHNEIHIPIDKILQESEPNYRLWFILEKYGFNYDQVKQIMQSVKNEPGKKFTAKNYQLLIDREYLILREVNTQSQRQLTIEKFIEKSTFNELNIQFERCTSSEVIFTENPETAYFDEEKVVFPLTIRNWEKGDRLCPIGMNGKSKKVSDLLIDLKLSLFEKERVNVMLDSTGTIMWVIGLRIGHQFRITDSTNSTIRCRLIRQQ